MMDTNGIGHVSRAVADLGDSVEFAELLDAVEAPPVTVDDSVAEPLDDGLDPIVGVVAEPPTIEEPPVPQPAVS